MYEHRNSPPLSRLAFFLRMLKGLFIVLIITAISLYIGVIGYHSTEGFSWLDSLLNASMILGGMGPVNAIQTIPGKYFASFYALYSGIIIIGMAGVLLAPVVHRIMHKMHYINPENRGRNFKGRRHHRNRGGNDGRPERHDDGRNENRSRPTMDKNPYA